MPSGRREAERLALAIEVLVEAAPFETNGARERVDARSGHRREVDHDAVVTQGVAGDGVTAAAHRDEQIVLPRESHRRDHVGDPPAPSDERGLTLDLPVPDRPGLGIARLPALDHVTEQAGTELFGGSGLENSCHG